MLVSNKYSIFVIAKIRKVAALIGSGNSSIISEYRDKLAYSMAGHALRGNLESVDYKGGEHSNPISRSFIASIRRDFLIMDEILTTVNWVRIFFCMQFNIPLCN